MDLQLLNSLLEDLESIDSKKLRLVDKKDLSTPISKDSDGSQGDENTFEKVYQSVQNPDLYIKILYYTDSYGYGEFIRGVKIVKPIEKVVTVFE
jgi:hypothetical protein